MRPDGSSLAKYVFLQLGQDAERAPGVQEPDPGRTVATGPRLAVDRVDAGVAGPGERAGHVIDLVRDVVQALAASGDEAADRRVVLARLHQLDLQVANAERGRLHAAGLGHP